MSFGFQSHTFICEPKCDIVIQMGGQAHQGLIGTRSHNIDKWSDVGGHFEMRQNNVCNNFTIYALDGIEALLGNTI